MRDEKQADSEAIHELVAAAFRRPDEAVLVDCLRSDGASVISLVAVESYEIVGHVLFSRMTAPFRALGLGPVSVKPRAALGLLISAATAAPSVLIDLVE
jgi:putative acetyltransferase